MNNFLPIDLVTLTNSYLLFCQCGDPAKSFCCSRSFCRACVRQHDDVLHTLDPSLGMFNVNMSQDGVKMFQDIQMKNFTLKMLRSKKLNEQNQIKYHQQRKHVFKFHSRLQ